MNKPNKFTRGIPVPAKDRSWPAIFLSMEVDGFFSVKANRNEQRALYNAAAKVNVKIVTERHGKRIGVWRAK